MKEFFVEWLKVIGVVAVFCLPMTGLLEMWFRQQGL